MFQNLFEHRFDQPTSVKCLIVFCHLSIASVRSNWRLRFPEHSIRRTSTFGKCRTRVSDQTTFFAFKIKTSLFDIPNGVVRLRLNSIWRCLKRTKSVFVANNLRFVCLVKMWSIRQRQRCQTRRKEMICSRDSSSNTIQRQWSGKELMLQKGENSFMSSMNVSILEEKKEEQEFNFWLCFDYLYRNYDHIHTRKEQMKS